MEALISSQASKAAAEEVKSKRGENTRSPRPFAAVLEEFIPSEWMLHSQWDVLILAWRRAEARPGPPAFDQVKQMRPASSQSLALASLLGLCVIRCALLLSLAAASLGLAL